MGSRGARMRSSWCDSEFPRDDPEGTSTVGIRRIAGWGPNSSSWSSDRRIPRRLAKDKGPDRGPPPPEAIGVPSAREDAPRVAEIAALTRRIDFASVVVVVPRGPAATDPSRLRRLEPGVDPASTVMRDRPRHPPSPSRGSRLRPAPYPAIRARALALVHVTSRTRAADRESRILPATVRHASRKSAKRKRAPRSVSCFTMPIAPRNRV
jgi:hypothetical protein